MHTCSKSWYSRIKALGNLLICWKPGSENKIMISIPYHLFRQVAFVSRLRTVLFIGYNSLFGKSFDFLRYCRKTCWQIRSSYQPLFCYLKFTMPLTDLTEFFQPVIIWLNRTVTHCFCIHPCVFFNIVLICLLWFIQSLCYACLLFWLHCK